jgi:hypothetical protein
MQAKIRGLPISRAKRRVEDWLTRSRRTTRGMVQPGRGVHQEDRIRLDRSAEPPVRDHPTDAEADVRDHRGDTRGQVGDHRRSGSGRPSRADAEYFTCEGGTCNCNDMTSGRGDCATMKRLEVCAGNLQCYTDHRGYEHCTCDMR